MRFSRNLFARLAIAFILISLSLAGCSSAKTSTNQPLYAITTIRTTLELPQLPLDFVETTNMANSPTCGLVIKIYRDADGHVYSVDPQTNQVVEIDARTILSKIPPHAPILLTEELEARVLKYFEVTIPNFESRKSSWQYEEGRKGNYFFFSWYSDMMPGTMNRSFAQIGMDINGVLFTYYNTLSLHK